MGCGFVDIWSEACAHMRSYFSVQFDRRVLTFRLRWSLYISNILISHSTTFTMDEKYAPKRASSNPSTSPSPPPNHARTASVISTNEKSQKHAEEIARIDALATAPGVSMASFAHLDEKAILRKMDLRLIPMLALLYLLSFLDRGNIGNAKIEGLTEDLNMSGAQYNWCLTVFFFTYAAFEVPSNLLLKKLRPSIWVSV